MRFASKGGTYRKEEEEVAVRWPLVPPLSWPPLFLFDPLLGPLPPAPPRVQQDFFSFSLTSFPHSYSAL